MKLQVIAKMMIGLQIRIYEQYDNENQNKDQGKNRIKNTTSVKFIYIILINFINIDQFL